MKKISKFKLLRFLIKAQIKRKLRYLFSPIKAFILKRKNIHVVGFITWDKIVNYKEVTLYGLSNNEFNTFEEFNKDLFKDSRIYMNALYNYVTDNNIKITGSQHQNNRVPLFSDNKTMSCSMRRWGRIMALIWSKKENKNYHYMYFYM